MSEHFIDPTQAVDGDGSLATPWNTLVGKAATGRILRCKRGTKLTTGATNRVLTISNVTDLVITDYGDSEAPFIWSGEATASWTFDASNDCWYTDAWTALTNSTGSVQDTVDGLFLTHVIWNTNIATTRALMPVNSTTMDKSTKRLYVVLGPSRVTGTLRVATSWEAIYSTAASTTSGIELANVKLEMWAGNSIDLGGLKSSRIHDLSFSGIGGYWSGTFYGGAAIQLYDGCDTVDVHDVLVEDVYDSGISPQSFVDGGVIKNINIYRNTVRRYALGGVEVATFLPNASVTGIRVYDNVMSYGGKGWSGRGDGPTYTDENRAPTSGMLVFATPASSVLEVEFSGNQCDNGYMVAAVRGSRVGTKARFIGNRGSNNEIGLWLRNLTFAIDAGTHVFERNVLDGLTDAAVHCSIQYGATNNLSVVGNTFTGVTGDGYRQTYAVAAATLKNNVIQGSSAGTGVNITGTAPTESHNAVSGFGTQASGITLTSPVTDEPDVTSDGRPMPSSPLIGAGVHLGYSTDIDGAARFNPPTIGAYEAPRARSTASAREPRV